MPKGIRIMSTRRCLALGLVVSLLRVRGMFVERQGRGSWPRRRAVGHSRHRPGRRFPHRRHGHRGGARSISPVALEMEIYLTEDANPFAGAGNTPLYRLDGLLASSPNHWRFGFPSTRGNRRSGGYGRRELHASVNDLVTGFRMLATTVTEHRGYGNRSSSTGSGARCRPACRCGSCASATTWWTTTVLIQAPALRTSEPRLPQWSATSTHRLPQGQGGRSRFDAGLSEVAYTTFTPAGRSALPAALPGRSR